MNLNEIIANSNSNELVNSIAETMNGSTFHHNYHILYDIRTLLGSEKKTYTEIGTYCGGSCSLMLQHNFDTDIYCIDSFVALKNQYDILESNINRYNKYNRNVTIYKNYSTDIELLNKLKSTNFKTDILFIDGGHHYNTVIADFNNYCKFVNIGGYIIFDDYMDYIYSPDVKKAVDNIVLNIKSEMPEQYEIIGCLPNIQNSYVKYDIGNMLNEFVIKKIA